MKSRNLLYFIIILGTYADNVYAKEPKVDNDLQAQSMLSVLYAQSSAEYEANNLQTYASAKLALDKALSNKKWTAALEQKDNYQTKPPAVILD
jgi:predicted secreted acid phosphatase